jgi:hypothetical protein
MEELTEMQRVEYEKLKILEKNRESLKSNGNTNVSVLMNNYLNERELKKLMALYVSEGNELDKKDFIVWLKSYSRLVLFEHLEQLECDHDSTINAKYELFFRYVKEEL